MVSLFSGLIGDLEHARRASLLVEIQRKHIDEIVKEHPTFELKKCCDNIFNKGLPQLKTNVVVIDAYNKKQAQLLHAVIGLIEDSLKRKKEIDSAVNLGLHFATLGLSEFIDGSITDNIANYIDETWDVFQESVSQFIGKKVEEKIVGKAEEGTEQFINSTKAYYQPGTTLYLSKKAKAKFASLTNKLIKNHSPSEAMQFLVELVATLGEDAPKLLVINDPFSLDAESLSFCSLLMSYAKDLKQQGRTLPVSVVFNYTSKQPYDNESKEEKNFQPLLRMRHMMQRYDMLEKPDSNIPSPAIKSTTFVGRREELAQLMRQHDELLEASFKSEDVRICQWTLIKGEPGTGKTALINRHLTELEKLSDDASKSQIRLRLLNQVGHSSQVTGLASLLQSIHAEASRLSQCYKESNGLLSYYIKETVNKYKKSAHDIVSLSEEVLRTKKVTSNEVKKALKAIADIANKEKLYASAEAMYDRTKIKGSAKQSAEAFTEGGTQNKKQEAFDKLSNSLKHLCVIANAVSPMNKKMPLILVIDDLQWIDELSAEYIFEHLLRLYSIELLITSRDSDTQTSYKLAQAKSEYLPYTIRIFDKANILVTGSTNIREDKILRTHEAVTKPIFIEGMDRLTVVSLLKATYEISEEVGIDIFGVIADSLIKCLSGNESDENKQVNTLFVIETLNLLSDPAFYRRHSTISPIFASNDEQKYCLTINSGEVLKINIERAFNLLKKTHKAAYEDESMRGSDEQQQFSLASYAIMEERIYIISQYFGDEYSDAIALSLFFSSLMGTPFSSEVVKELIHELTHLDPKVYTELEPLIVFLNRQQGISAKPEHYVVLEELFGIIKRMPTYYLYQYKHGLYRAFLRERLKKFLNEIFEYKTAVEHINCFFMKIIDILSKTLNGSSRDVKSGICTVTTLFNFYDFFYELTSSLFWLERLLLASTIRAKELSEGPDCAATISFCQEIIDKYLVLSNEQYIERFQLQRYMGSSFYPELLAKSDLLTVLEGAFYNTGYISKALEVNEGNTRVTKALVELGGTDDLRLDTLIVNRGVYLKNLRPSSITNGELAKEIEIYERGGSDLEEIFTYLNTSETLRLKGEFSYSVEVLQKGLLTASKYESSEWINLRSLLEFDLALCLLQNFDDQIRGKAYLASALKNAQMNYTTTGGKYLETYAKILNSSHLLYGFSEEALVNFRFCGEMVLTEVEKGASGLLMQYVDARFKESEVYRQRRLVNLSTPILQDCVRIIEGTTMIEERTQWYLTVKTIYFNLFNDFYMTDERTALSFARSGIAALHNLYEKDEERYAKVLFEDLINLLAWLTQSELERKEFSELVSLSDNIISKHYECDRLYWGEQMEYLMKINQMLES